MDSFCRKTWSETLIPVALSPEPSVFQKKVRNPGEKFLKRNPRPRSKDYKQHRYWQRISEEIRDAYSAICAYSCHWIPEKGVSVDHFQPKAANPSLAYEWDNYRLTTPRINSSKGEHTDVLDPIGLASGTFEIDFTSFFIRPSVSLGAPHQIRAQATIDRLRLNLDDALVKARISWLKAYFDSNNIDWLRSRAPFIAEELVRQPGMEPEVRRVLSST